MVPRRDPALELKRGLGWGTASIERDALELGDHVRYFRSRGKDKIVLLGHSTGCQDLIAYFHLRSYSRVPPLIPRITALILQAPVSDREYVLARGGPITLPSSEAPEALEPRRQRFLPPAHILTKASENPVEVYIKLDREAKERDEEESQR